MVEGATATLRVVLQPLTPEEEKRQAVALPPPGPPERQFGIVPWVVGGSGIVVAIAGGTLIGISQVNAGKIKNMCEGTDCSELQGDELDKAQGLYDSARALEIAGWASLGVGLAAVGAGAVMYYLDARRMKKSAHMEVGQRTQMARTLVLPSVSSREVGIQWVGTF
jgi:hypothetical protein